MNAPFIAFALSAAFLLSGCGGRREFQIPLSHTEKIDASYENFADPIFALCYSVSGFQGEYVFHYTAKAPAAGHFTAVQLKGRPVYYLTANTKPHTIILVLNREEQWCWPWHALDEQATQAVAQLAAETGQPYRLGL